MSPQHVGVPWFPENIVTPTWELVTALLMFAAAYMSMYSEPSAVNELP
jgi:CO dehydrogenase/acetyl-CoA synthase delta subunit